MAEASLFGNERGIQIFGNVDCWSTNAQHARAHRHRSFPWRWCGAGLVGGLLVLTPARGFADPPALSEEQAAEPPPLIEVVPGGLTRDTVVAGAIAHEPGLRERTAERGLSQSRIDQAWSAFLPRVKLSATYRRVSSVEVPLGDAAIVGARNEGALLVGPEVAPGGPNVIVDSEGQPIGAQSFVLHSIEDQYELKAELGIPLSDLLFRMGDTVGAAESGSRAADHQRVASTRDVALEASIAYYSWLRAEGSVRVAERALARMRALANDVLATSRAGLSTSVDVARVDSLLASTEVTVAEANRMRTLSRRQLQLLLSDESLDPRPGENVLVPPGPAPALSEQQAIQRAEAQRPELRALREALNAARQQRASNRVGQYPRLDGFAQVLYGRPNANIFIPQDEWKPTWAAGLTLSYTPNDTLTGSIAARQSELEYQRVEAQLARAERGIKLQIAAAAADRDKANTSVQSAGRSRRAAAEAHRAARRLYRAGEATTTDVLEAEAQLFSAELQQLTAILDALTSRARLAHAVGDDLTR